MGLSLFRGAITGGGEVFLLKVFWLKGGGRKKKSRQPYEHYATKATLNIVDRPGRREAAFSRASLLAKSRASDELSNSAIVRRSTCNGGRRNYRSSMREDYSAAPKTAFPISRL